MKSFIKHILRGCALAIALAGITFAQPPNRRPPPAPNRRYEIRPDVTKKQELSRRIEQRRMELRREDQIKDRRKSMQKNRERGGRN